MYNKNLSASSIWKLLNQSDDRSFQSSQFKQYKITISPQRQNNSAQRQTISPQKSILSPQKSYISESRKFLSPYKQKQSGFEQVKSPYDTNKKILKQKTLTKNPIVSSASLRTPASTTHHKKYLIHLFNQLSPQDPCKPLMQTPRQLTNHLAQKHYQRKLMKEKQLKQNVLNRILSNDLTESQIKKENQQELSKSQKQYKVSQFVQRQQFKSRETQILKQMQQFIKYGAIRQNFH